MSDLIPITDEQAKAIQEVAKVGGQGLEIIKASAGYFARVLGTVPEDIVGIIGGDALRIRRVENAARMIQDAQKRLTARSVEGAPPPLTLVSPILNEGSEEERPELVDLWSRLLAAAMDRSRVASVRQSFIDTVKAMDPADALVLNGLPVHPPSMSPDPIQYLSSHMALAPDQVELSLLHLAKLNVLYDTQTDRRAVVVGINKVDFTVFGRELMRLLRD